MTFRRRDYRVRVYAADDSDVEYVLGLADLTDVPVVTGLIPHPTAGYTELQPFTVRALDRGGAFTAWATGSGSGRWQAIGRLVDVQYCDILDADYDYEPAAEEWVTFGTGRLSSLSQPAGPQEFDIEVSDESWKGRKAAIFTKGGTTQLWPVGVRGTWRSFLAAHSATGWLASSQGNVRLIKVEAGGLTRPRGRRIPDSLVRWLESQRIIETVTGPTATAGNFGPVRLNYAGADYEVVTFGRSTGDDFLATLKSPLIRNAGRASETVEAWVWVVSESTPPASGECYLHAPDAPPDRSLPKHVGAASDPIWGTESGWIHPATLTRRYWQETGQRFDEDSLAAIEADSSLPPVAFRVTEVPKDPEQWFADHVWGPLLLIVLRDAQGRRKLVDLRLPQDLDPETLPLITASNSDTPTWRLSGREAVNSIAWDYTSILYGDLPELDGFVVQDQTTDPIRDDSSIAAVGERPVTYSLRGVLEPGRQFGEATVFSGVTAKIAREMFDLYRDGAFHFHAEELGRTLAETLAEGDLVLLDAGSLCLPNPASGAHSGHRLARIMRMAIHPAHAEIEVLDAGPSAQPLLAPTITVVQSETDADVAIVTLSGVPSGALALVEVGFSATVEPPASWAFARPDLGNGTHLFRGLPPGGFVHARAKSLQPGRIRSLWSAHYAELLAVPRILEADVQPDELGTGFASGTASAATAGVRIFHDRHDSAEDPNLSEYVDVEVIAGAWSAIVPAVNGERLTIEAEPYPSYAAGEVGGTPGHRVRRSVDIPADGDLGPDAKPALVTSLQLSEINTAEGKFVRVSVGLSEHAAAWSSWERDGASWPTVGGSETGALDDLYLRVRSRSASQRSYDRTASPGTRRVIVVGENMSGRTGPRKTASIVVGSGGQGSEPGALADLYAERTEAGVVLSWTANASITAAPGRYLLDIERNGIEAAGDVDPEAASSYTDTDAISCTPGEVGCSYQVLGYRLILRDTDEVYADQQYTLQVSDYFQVVPE